LNLIELKEILQLLDEKDISEFELEEEGIKLRIKKASSSNHVAPPPLAPLVPMVPAAASPPLPANPPGTAPPPAAEPATAEAEEGLAVVKSPIVGTFFRAPDPNGPPFVDVGDRVKPGQVLCIIEAMKLMNEIEAEVAGEIVKVHPENGQPVQYGEALFSIRTAS
jgi:acetyl-CoA carboxylase biotin carboxyl carrier protein